MNNKPSLRVLDEHDEMQSIITNQAALFAELTLQEAKRNSLTREQVIKDSQTTGKVCIFSTPSSKTTIYDK